VPDAFGKWEFVGGTVDFGEDPETALIREVAEESGLVVQIVRLFPKIFTHVWKTKTGEYIHVLLVTYECVVVSGQLNNHHVADEIGDLQFVSPGVLQKMDTLPNVRETLKYL
jgi:8-oxo-dGTP diphosphatase